MPQVKREKSRPRRGASRAQKRVKREPETVGPSRAPSRANIPPTLIRTPSSLDSATSNPPDPNFVNNGTPPQPQGIPDPAYILTEIENYASTQAPDRILPRIHSLPRLRPLEFAITVAHGKPVTFHSQINQNAALTYSRGREIVGANVCVRCTAGKGTYQKCVVLEEFNKGSCANCVINCYGHKCSFRTSRMYTSSLIPELCRQN
ncbi:hypothetical protein EV426DRAFT_224377 [Tirmania nivea]|nr:hypothetical protein EV426DRAFT_224377 [Tirmania nivea]